MVNYIHKYVYVRTYVRIYSICTYVFDIHSVFLFYIHMNRLLLVDILDKNAVFICYNL